MRRREDDLDEQLRSANLVRTGVAEDAASCALLDEIGARIVASGRPLEGAGRGRFSRPTARRGVILGSVVGVLAVGVAAAATVLSTDTAGAPGFCQTVVSETASIPFPDGYQAWRNWALLQSTGPKLGTTLQELCAGTIAGEHVADNGVLSPSGSPATVVIPPISEKVQFVEAAFCAWTDQWLNSQADRDTAAASQAASEIAGASQWQAAQEINQPDSHVGPQQLAWLAPVQQAVQANDVSAVTRTFVYYPKGTIPDSECLAAKPPANSDNGTLYDPTPWTPGQQG